MDLKLLKKMIDDLQILEFDNEVTKNAVFALVETMYQIIVAQAKEIQRLRDEINRLKGEKGKPDIKGNIKIETKEKKESMESQSKKEWKKKKKEIKIDREVVIEIDQDGLPDDAVFKDYREITIQNLSITTDNVLYKLEVYYSQSENKSYTAELDKCLQGTSFGPELKALIVNLYFAGRMTENLIHDFLTGFNIDISEGQISNIIIKEKEEKFTAEKEEILVTGVECSKGINIDDSGFRENGINKYINIICSILFSVFIVNDNKKGVTVKDMFKGLGIRGKPLICDDAPQWKKILAGILIQLCWVHEERHYKKLNPIVKEYREELDIKIGQIWDYYNGLKAYKENPNEKHKQLMLDMFEEIFNVTSNYPELDNRLKLTYAKKDELLLVLDYPEIDIHNNLSENGIRTAVIKRKISNGTRTKQGTNAWENHLSILSTCKKLGIRYYDYILEIFKNEEHKLSLVDAIKQKVADMA